MSVTLPLSVPLSDDDRALIVAALRETAIEHPGWEEDRMQALAARLAPDQSSGSSRVGGAA